MAATRNISLVVSLYPAERVDAAVAILKAQFPYASRGFHQLSKTCSVPTINVFADVAALSANVHAAIRNALETANA